MTRYMWGIVGYFLVVAFSAILFGQHHPIRELAFIVILSVVFVVWGRVRRNENTP